MPRTGVAGSNPVVRFKRKPRIHGAFVVPGGAGGIAVNIGARVAGRVRPSDVLVLQTVKDLVTGSGLVFEDAGEHELKGVPDRWRLYRAIG